MSAIPVGRSHAPRAALPAGFAEWLHDFPTLAAVAALIWIPFQLLQAILAIVLGVGGSLAAIDAAAGRSASGAAVDAGSLAGPAATLGAYVVLAAALTVVALALAQAALSPVAAAGLQGGRLAVGEAFAAARGRLLAVVGANLLVGALIVAVELVLALLAAVLAFALGFAHLAPVATGLGALALLVAPIVVFVGVATAPQAAALDGLGPVAALRQARAELRGRFWTTLLVVVVTGFVAWLVAAALGALAAALLGGTASIVAQGMAAAAAGIVAGPLPQVALTALHLEARSPAA